MSLIPAASPDAFADDTGALGPDAATIQKVATLTSEFAVCTQQELSLKKSFAFCTDVCASCRVLLHGSLLKVVADADVLGARIAFHGDRLEGPLKSKAHAAILVAQRIMLAPLSFEQHALLVRALATSRVIFGAAIAAVPWSDMRKLRTVLSSAVWGRRSKFRCNEVLHSLLCHGHAIDPVLAIAYDSLLICQRVLRRQPGLQSLFNDVWRSRSHRRLSVVGPVGNLLNATKLLGLDWLAPDSLAACIWDRRQLDFL